MGYGDRYESAPVSESTSTVIFTSLARGLGLVLVLAGLVTVTFIMMEAWALYKYPERIEVIAVAVEKGSNIDKALLPKRHRGESDVDANADRDALISANVRLSYFFAWFIAFEIITLQ